MSEDPGDLPDLPVTNQVVGDIEGATVQARDIHGDVYFGASGSPELHANPLVVSFEPHGNYLVKVVLTSH